MSSIDLTRAGRIVADLDTTFAAFDRAVALEVPLLRGRGEAVSVVRDLIDVGGASARTASLELAGLGVAGAADARAAVDELARQAEQAVRRRGVHLHRNDLARSEAMAGVRAVRELVESLRLGHVQSLDRTAASTIVARRVLAPDAAFTAADMQLVDDLAKLPEAIRPALPNPVSTSGRLAFTRAAEGVAAGGSATSLRAAELQRLRTWVMELPDVGDHVVAARLAAKQDVDPTALATLVARGPNRLNELGVSVDDVLRAVRTRLDHLEATPDADKLAVVGSLRAVLQAIPAVGPEQVLVDRSSLLLLRASQRMQGRVPAETLEQVATRQATGHQFPDYAEIGRTSSNIDLLLEMRRVRTADAVEARIRGVESSASDVLTW